MKKSRIVLICTITMLLLALAIPTFAQKSISVVLDGQKLEFQVEPTIINGRTMVPMRAIFTALGATVDWIDQTRTATAQDSNGTIISITIGNNVMYAGTKEITLDSPAVIRQNSTLVPVRAISESMDCQVGWDPADNTVSIIKDKEKYKMLYTQDNRSKAFEVSQVSQQRDCGWFETQINAKNDNTVLTFGDYNVESNEFLYYFVSQLEYSDIPFEALLDKEEYAKYVDSVVHRIKTNAALDILCAQHSIYLSDTEYKDLITTYMNQLKSYYGESFESELQSAGLTPELFEKQIRTSTLYQKLLQQTTQPGGAYDFYDAELLQSLATANNLIRAKHILIMVDPQENKEEKLALAKQVLQKAKAGEDFDKLIEQYNQDPGMASSPDGYYFVEGEMVTEFYEASKALELNGISNIVETAYGYHIIQRLPYEENSLAASSFGQTITQELEQQNIMNKIENICDNMDVQYAPDFETNYSLEKIMELLS